MKHFLSLGFIFVSFCVYMGVVKLSTMRAAVCIKYLNLGNSPNIEIFSSDPAFLLILVH